MNREKFRIEWRLSRSISNRPSCFSLWVA